MLYQSIASLQLIGCPLYKISHLFPTVGSTMLLIGMGHPASQYILVFNSDGSIRSKHLISFCYSSAAMINPSLLLFLVPTSVSSYIFDLKDGSFRPTCFEWKYQSLSIASITVFAQSSTFCIHQVNGSKQLKLGLSYYHASQIDQLQPFASMESPFQAQRTITKGNNISIIIWYKLSSKELLQFWSFDPRRAGQKKQAVHWCNLKNRKLGASQLPVNFIAIFGIWQREDIFFAAVYGMADPSSSASYDTIPLVLRINQKNEIISCSPIDLTGSPFFISFSNLGRYYVVADDWSVSFISNESAELVKSRPSSRHTTLVAHHLCQTTLTYHCQQQAITKVDVKITKIMEQKQAYLSLMLQVDEDFDDDLLYDALRLLQAL